MANYCLFHMWDPLRETQIARHRFYVDQARSRLLAQFNDIEGEASQAAEAWFEEISHRVNPDSDSSIYYEAANDQKIEFYLALTDMHEQTKLSVVAGMYHHWDKQLREWLVREMAHWHDGGAAPTGIWSTVDLPGLFPSLGWQFMDEPFMALIDACRLVVNVYKHGEGRSLEDLKATYPEYLEDPFHGASEAFAGAHNRDHTQLRVSDRQIEQFADAIEAFWRAVPEYTYDHDTKDIPGWLEKAFKKDREFKG